MKKLIIFFLFQALTLAYCTANSYQPNSMGDVFILIGEDNSGISKRTLVKLSSDCFVMKITCPSPEPISAFPKDFTPYNWANMYWSPNGKYMYLVNSSFDKSKIQYLEELFSYDAQNERVNTIISGYKYISGISWRPNSESAAMSIKGPEDEDMQIVLVNPNGEVRFLPITPALDAGYPPHIFNGQVFEDNQSPVQWLSENELIFVRERSESQTEHPEDLQEIPVRHLFRFNILTAIETEIQLPLREANYTLSPNNALSFYTPYYKEDGSNKVFSFKTKQITDLKDFSPAWQMGVWSPNSKWILTCMRGYATYVVTPDLAKVQKLIDNCPIYSIWMPDSDHVILFFFSHENNGQIIETHWYIASISEGSLREITIPDLDLKDRYVNGIYVQPVKLP